MEGKQTMLKNRKIHLAIFMLAIILSPAMAAAEANFVLGVTPGIFLYSPDLDGFQVTDNKNTDEISGSISNVGTLLAGVGIDTKPMYVDLTAGLGYLYTSTFNSVMYVVDGALRFKLTREITLGPHLSVIKYKPGWDGDADIDLDDTTGFSGGLGLTIGGKALSLAVGVDYVNADFEVKPPGRSIKGDNLDISGMSLNLGILCRF